MEPDRGCPNADRGRCGLPLRPNAAVAGKPDVRLPANDYWAASKHVRGFEQKCRPAAPRLSQRTRRATLARSTASSSSARKGRCHRQSRPPVLADRQICAIPTTDPSRRTYRESALPLPGGTAALRSRRQPVPMDDQVLDLRAPGRPGCCYRPNPIARIVVKRAQRGFRFVAERAVINRLLLRLRANPKEESPAAPERRRHVPGFVKAAVSAGWPGRV